MPVFHDDFDVQLALLARLAIAALLGGVLGWERKRAGKAAGLRTHMVVAVSAALYAAVATLLGARAAGADGGVRADLIGVVQAVAAGVGFLGAGLIFVTPDRSRVRGLTTAASVWGTAAVGLTTGAGYAAVAAGAAVLLWLILQPLTAIDRGVTGAHAVPPRAKDEQRG